MGDGLREVRAARITAKEARGPGLESTVGKACGQFLVGGPYIGAFREKERQENIGQDLGDSRFANERHFLRGWIRGEGVMKIPKRMTEFQEKLLSGLRIFSFERAGEQWPRIDECGEGAESPLWMIQGTSATPSPELGR